MNARLISRNIAKHIVVDTNCLVMSVSKRNSYKRVWQSLLSGKFVLCVSTEIMAEYAEVLGRNISPYVADMVIETILHLKNVFYVTPYYRFHLITADEDDNKFVDCAIAANAKYIVTEDHHFDVLRSIPFPSVEVMGIDDFLKELEEA